MASAYPITGIPDNWRKPGGYAEVLFAQGPAAAAGGARDVVFVMPMLSTGTATAGTEYRVRTSNEAEALFGAGSPLHRAIKKFMSANKDAKVYAIPVAETSGGSPVAATATVTYTTTATGTITAIVTICGEDCSFTGPSGTDVTTLATGIKNAINDKTWLPVVATNVAGVLTLSAKLKGISQGTASLGVIRIRATVTAGVGTSVATSGAFLGSGAAGAEGSSTEAANFATSLSKIDAVRRYYIVTSANDATSLGNLKTHIITKSEPKQGLRSVGICAYTGSLATAQTLAIGRNYERLAMLLQVNSEHDCAELAGAWAAIRHKNEQTDSAFCFDGIALDPYISNVYAVSDYPDADDVNDAICDGITIVESGPTGPHVAMSVDTRSKNSAGTQDDFRATETHRISVCDEFTDEVLTIWANQYGGTKARDDEYTADGKVDYTQTYIRGVTQPSQIGVMLKKQMDVYETNAKLQDAATTKQSVNVVKEGSRFACFAELRVIDHAHQATFKFAEVSPG